jgi:acetoin utilization deacetylase AcuC-like enzyme
MDSFVLYYPEDHQKHQLLGHPERPERIEVIKQGLKDINLWDNVPKVKPDAVSDDIFSFIHESEYLANLKKASSQEQMLDLDTYTTRDSWQLALNAAGGAVALAESVWKREYRNGFALTRPPGHHATKSRGMGFCLINNVAVAAESLLQNHDANKIAIIDIDLHHGNGTQDIFWHRSDVSYVSIHQAPFYPGTGAVFEQGEAKGEKCTLNLPIPSQSGDLAYRTLLLEIIITFLDDQKPDMLLISFGFDTHWRDPLGSMLVTGSGVYQLIQILTSWAESNCKGRIAVFLEGGYDLEAGRVCGQAVATALVDLEWKDPIGPAPSKEGDAWRNTLREAKRIWKYG